jgi:hypothetical protein
MAKKPVTLGRLSPEDNIEIKDAQLTMQKRKDLVRVPSVRDLVLTLIRMYVRGELR